MKKDWHGILKIEEFKIFEKNELIFEKYNLYNIMHQGGEALILGILFANYGIPSSYYVGLDSRASLSESQNLSNIQYQEPTTNGYQRQTVSSSTGFTITNTAPAKATSSMVNFTASAAGSWGPVKNMFLCTAFTKYGGTLISSVPLGTDLTVNANTVVSMKFSMTLSSC